MPKTNEPFFSLDTESGYDASDENFIEYLKGLVLDLRESAMHDTADDFDECIRRLRRNDNG